MIYLEYIGIAAFAISGAMTAIDREADIFGVLFLAVVTALGGGVIRDTLLGELPPRMFTSYPYIMTALACALAVFLVAYIRRDIYLRNLHRVDIIVNVFDALGLAAFTVSGMNIAIESYGFSNPVLLTVLGMTTGVGGGMLRDVLSGCMPSVLYKRVYAVASLAGALLYYALLRFGMTQFISAVISITAIFGLRYLATVFNWNLPHVAKEE